ncbi:tetratricopeptide repeat protein [Nonomuraea sp. NPDC049695]|uniref:tetratricopeptide repeat protein n=1 Tax=Nonomuraea sp. NPDC049695 TaxID=3154734 RepID=UPI003413C9BC
MTDISRKDRLLFRLSRLSKQAGAHLPELGLGGLVTAGGTVLLLQEKLMERVAEWLPPWLLVILILSLPVATGWLTHVVRSRRRPEPQPIFHRQPFPDRIDGLVGRDAEIQQVQERAKERGIVVVQGAMGMGTSAVSIAATWGLTADARKQRYADLRGPDRDRPETPLSVAQRVLRTLDRPPGAIQEPQDATAQVMEALTGTDRVLLLDNVSTWSQVAWLPPRVPGAHIVVAGTFTDELPQHVEPIRLGPLSSEDGRRLLARHVGEERVNRDPKALGLLVDACLGTPLEIIRIGRWLARNRKVTLQDLVDDLRSVSVDKMLDFVLERSITQLRPMAQQLFVLLAGLPIAEVDHLAAAALLGVPSAGDAIGELADLGLVENVRMTRVRVAGAFRRGGTPLEAAAWRRLVEHFADRADTYGALLPGEEARAWFAIEDRVLLQVLAFESPVPKTARALARIADGLETWFRLEQRHEDRLRAAEALARAAKTIGDEHVQATAELRQCAILLTWGDPRKARQHFDQAAALRVKVESWPAELHLQHAAILLAGGDEFTAVESALVRYGQALSGGDFAGHSIRLTNVAALLLRKGQTLDHDGRGTEARRLYVDARAVLYESLALAERASDPSAAAHAQELLALAHHYLDQPHDANSHLKEAERLYAESADEVGRARCLVQRAVALLDQPDHRQDEVVALLEEAEPRLPPAGVSMALTHLHLARLRPDRAAEHRAAGLAALAPWDGIAEPRQVSELRASLAAL